MYQPSMVILGMVTDGADGFFVYHMSIEDPQIQDSASETNGSSRQIGGEPPLEPMGFPHHIGGFQCSEPIQSHDGSMVLLYIYIYGNMDPMNIPQSC